MGAVWALLYRLQSCTGYVGCMGEQEERRRGQHGCVDTGHRS